MQSAVISDQQEAAAEIIPSHMALLRLYSSVGHISAVTIETGITPRNSPYYYHCSECAVAGNVYEEIAPTYLIPASTLYLICILGTLEINHVQCTPLISHAQLRGQLLFIDLSAYFTIHWGQPLLVIECLHAAWRSWKVNKIVWHLEQL